MTKIRCNNCMNIMEETPDNQIYKCSKCGRDDCLTNKFDDEKGSGGSWDIAMDILKQWSVMNKKGNKPAYADFTLVELI